jgi:hypothetical protein
MEKHRWYRSLGLQKLEEKDGLLGSTGIILSKKKERFFPKTSDPPRSWQSAQCEVELRAEAGTNRDASE